jgi:Domain of unknown function (DUF6378)
MASTKKPVPVASPGPMRELVERALSTVEGTRQSEYGARLDNFTQIAMAFQATLARKIKPGEVITSRDVALLMMQVKLVRLAHNPEHADSLLDIIGYSLCYEDINDSVKHLGNTVPRTSALDVGKYQHE